MDETARWGTGVDRPDEKLHLAKVRVAGSNPVFRSNKGPGGREGDTRRNGTESPRSPRPTGGDRPRRSADSTGRTRARQRGATEPQGRTPPEKRGGRDTETRRRGFWRAWGGLRCERRCSYPCPLTNPLCVKTPISARSGRVRSGRHRETRLPIVGMGPGVTSPKNRPCRVESRSRRLRVVP